MRKGAGRGQGCSGGEVPEPSACSESCGGQGGPGMLQRHQQPVPLLQVLL